MKKKYIVRKSVCISGMTLGLIVCNPSAPGQTNQTTSNASPTATTNSASTNVTELGTTTVLGHMSPMGSQIQSSIGATSYAISTNRLAAEAGGENAQFSQVLLRAPGVAQDSAVNGDLHIRGEHANVQYRIDDVLLPEGIAGFGLELDPRFVQTMQLIDGALPAQYGYRTAGIVDIQTKSGSYVPGGEVGFYGGSYDTFRPFFEYGGSEGKFNYYIDGSYDHNELGIENPTGASTAIHDETEQFKSFMYASYIMDPTSKLIFMGSASYSDYQIPNQPNLPSGVAPGGQTYGSAMATQGILPSGTFNSADDNENQNEQNYFSALSYLKTIGDLSFQLSAFGRESEQHFTPDPIGDLYLNGEASEVHRYLYSTGLQLDATYDLTDNNTIRAGEFLLVEGTQNNSSSEVFTLDSSGNPTGTENIIDDHPLSGLFIGTYLEDEWKIFPELTLNFGARFDVFESSLDCENQLSPRANLVYTPFKTTTFHAGYSRYFTPPPVENEADTVLSKFANTSGAPLTYQDSPVKAERANYYDAGFTQTILPGWTAGIDGYYKTAQNQLDDGLFGQSLILSSFNYEKGRIYGLEFSTAYAAGGFSLYANGAYSVAQGEDWNSAQFLFAPQDLAYAQNHWIYLDHDQTFTGTAGISYTYKESHNYSTMGYMDIVSGSGLRQDGGGFEFGPGSNPIPNGATVPDYYEINLGVAQTIPLSHKQFLKARIDIVNVTDNVYELRSATGVGVNLAQYGMRRGIFGTLSYHF